MTEIAQTYLGNLRENSLLAEQIEIARQLKHYLEVEVETYDCPKGRIQAQSSSGITVGIIKDRNWQLRSQDVFQTTSGNLLLINLKSSQSLVISFEPTADFDPSQLVYLGHYLGDRHYKITLKNSQIHIQSRSDLSSIQAAIAKLQIPGLQLSYE